MANCVWIYDSLSGTGKNFPQNVSTFPCQYHFTDAPQSCITYDACWKTDQPGPHFELHICRYLSKEFYIYAVIIGNWLRKTYNKEFEFTYAEWFRIKGQYCGGWRYQSLWEKRLIWTCLILNGYSERAVWICKYKA